MVYNRGMRQDAAGSPFQTQRQGGGWLASGLFTPLLLLAFLLTPVGWYMLVWPVTYCLNSITLPLCCLHLIWSALALKGSRRGWCLALLAVNLGLLFWLAYYRMVIWLWWLD